MARTVPSPQKLRQIRNSILRSVYFRQKLPVDTFRNGVGWVSAEMTVLVNQGLLVDIEGTFELTELGRASLFKMNRGRPPKMISMKREIFDRSKAGQNFIVGRSLADEIFREVSFND